jgi:CRP-like cAMP-binding protein
VERIPVGGVFVFVGFKPVGRHLFEEHVDHDENGYLLTDQYMRTNIPGVYACGDTRAQLAKQVTTAVGDATTAVLHAERYIEELKHVRKSFPDVPSETLEREVERMKPRRFLAGQTIIREGEPADSFFILTRGAASVRQNGPNGEAEISTLKPGDFFGEIGLLSGTPRNATVRATAPSEVLELDAAGFRDLVESSQRTKDRVQASMEERLAKAGGKP